MFSPKFKMKIGGFFSFRTPLSSGHATTLSYFTSLQTFIDCKMPWEDLFQILTF